MALKGPITIEFGKVFPGGAYAAGPVEKVRDFERSRKDEVIQQLDKDSVILSFRVSRCFDLRRPVVDNVADGTLAA